MNGFNTYTIGLDLSFLKDYCTHHGRLAHYSKGDYFVKTGETSRFIGYVDKGCFKYIVRNVAERKDFITGFAFDNEFVGDYPHCLFHQISDVTIEAETSSDVYYIDGTDLKALFETGSQTKELALNIYKNLFSQVYSQYLDFYRTSARERYLDLLHRCPQIVQNINLKDIASYLHVTPTTISTIRREITFGASSLKMV